jgi:hypothetical protein
VTTKQDPVTRELTAEEKRKVKQHTTAYAIGLITKKLGTVLLQVLALIAIAILGVMGVAIGSALGGKK